MKNRDRPLHAVPDPSQIICDPVIRSALVSFFRRRVGSAADAEDMAQEVLVRMAQLPTPPADARSFAFRIAGNLLTDQARREQVRRRYRDDQTASGVGPVDPIDPLRILLGRDELGRLTRAIGQLPEKTRRIFILYRIEHVEKRMIAESFGLSLRMVEIHIQRALALLIRGMDDAR